MSNIYKKYTTDQIKKDIKTLNQLKELRMSQGDDLCEVNIRALHALLNELNKRTNKGE